jgi:uncharacterized RDD family membrane protein YckC
VTYPPPLRNPHPPADDGYPQDGYAVPAGGGFQPPPGGFQPPPGGGYQVPPGHQAFPPPPKPTTPDGRPLAEFSDRLLAKLIDVGIMTAVNLVGAIPAVIGLVLVIQSYVDDVTYDADGYVTDSPSLATIILPIVGIYAGLLLLGVLANYLYQVEFALRRNGLTVGKRVMKIKAVPLEDSAAPVTARPVLQLDRRAVAALGPAIQAVPARQVGRHGGH